MTASPILFRLLLDFLQIGFFSIGGGYAVIPLIKALVVDTRHYLTLRQFTDIITISQMTPGPLAVNTSTFVGLQTGGIPGAVAATFGCVFSGFVISLLLYRFLNRYKASPYGAAILSTLKAASLGLILSASFTICLMAFDASEAAPDIITSAIKNAGIPLPGISFSAVALFLASFGAVRYFKMNPVLAMTLTGILGYFIYQ